MGGADQRPFGLHFLDASQQELPEAACLLDLSEYRLDDLLSEPVPVLRHPARLSLSRMAFVSGPVIFRLTSAGCLARPVAT